jgi:UDP-N-acetylmuramoylalanine-D-glutamate ligase
MNYHRNIKNYFAAKKNIINYQDNNDTFIYNLKNKSMANWKKQTKANAVPFEFKNFLDDLINFIDFKKELFSMFKKGYYKEDIVKILMITKSQYENAMFRYKKIFLDT